MGANTILIVLVAAVGAYLGATWARAQRALADVRRTLNNLSMLRRRANLERGRLVLVTAGALAMLYVLLRGR